MSLEEPRLPGDGIPLAPGMEPALGEARAPRVQTVVDSRVALVSAIAAVLGLAAGFIAEGLVRLIGLMTSLAFHHRFSLASVSPAGHHLGWAMPLVPVAGGLAVGVLARYGSRAIRGHGIPEAMEQVLLNSSRIPARVTFLKPLSAAIAIGTGGPFGAEGPIIATGGALGSVVGQRLPVTAMERKTLLPAAGASASDHRQRPHSRPIIPTSLFPTVPVPCQPSKGHIPPRRGSTCWTSSGSWPCC